MKTLSILFTVATVALATANAASAYSWSPPKGSVRLHGKITFTPNEGGQPFKCSVTMDFKPARGQITAVKFPHGDCEGVHFGPAFPWNVAIDNADSGGFAGGEFGSGSGTCVQNGEAFQVNGSGIWTLTGECLVGTLTSYPPTTMVP
jgi:hypothetical protein